MRVVVSLLRSKKAACVLCVLRSPTGGYQAMENIIKYLLEETTLWVQKLIGALVIFVVFVILAKIIKRIITGAAGRLNIDRDLTSLFARSGNITITIFGFVIEIGTLGINISAIVAGLGLTVFALGFALKDTISNLLSGVLILLYRPFEKGDRIKISDFQGIVVAIDMRYTKLDSDGNKVLIPNSKLFTDPITVLH
jgi:small conductance mechanosensitive channel